MAQSEFVVYELWSYLRPRLDVGQPTRCPECGGGLSQSSLNASAAALEYLKYCTMPDHFYCYLLKCAGCGWWCIHEMWADFETNSRPQFIILPAGAADTRDEPWLKALADPQIYDGDPAEIPPALAEFFPGETHAQFRERIQHNLEYFAAILRDAGLCGPSQGVVVKDKYTFHITFGGPLDLSGRITINFSPEVSIDITGGWLPSGRISKYFYRDTYVSDVSDYLHELLAKWITAGRLKPQPARSSRMKLWRWLESLFKQG